MSRGSCGRARSRPCAGPPPAAHARTTFGGSFASSEEYHSRRLFVLEEYHSRRLSLLEEHPRPGPARVLRRRAHSLGALRRTSMGSAWARPMIGSLCLGGRAYGRAYPLAEAPPSRGAVHPCDRVVPQVRRAHARRQLAHHERACRVPRGDKRCVPPRRALDHLPVSACARCACVCSRVRARRASQACGARRRRAVRMAESFRSNHRLLHGTRHRPVHVEA